MSCTSVLVQSSKKNLTYEFSKVQGFLADLASHGVPEEI